MLLEFLMALKGKDLETDQKKIKTAELISCLWMIAFWLVLYGVLINRSAI